VGVFWFWDGLEVAENRQTNCYRSTGFANSMDFTTALLDDLAATDCWAYQIGSVSAAEPTALAAIALLLDNRVDAACGPLDWLVRAQASEGSVGVTATERSPRWPTALAILAWKNHRDSTGMPRFDGCIDRAVRWALSAKGGTTGRKRQIGHDTTLVGWSWVLNTHSWIEPTALFVLALSAIGQAEHPRTREAVQLLVDRLLPSGGCNYGNTIVLGQELVPHVQPTGLAMLALAGHGVDDPRLGRSLDYLEKTLGPNEATASLCYGLMGLTAHDRRPTQADDWLAEAWQRTKPGDRSPYKQALLALAARRVGLGGERMTNVEIRMTKK
jgi:hypothetical protein